MGEEEFDEGACSKRVKKEVEKGRIGFDRSIISYISE